LRQQNHAKPDTSPYAGCALSILIRHHVIRCQLPEYRQNGKDETRTMVLASFHRHLNSGGGFCFLFCHSW
jgi:hypothetical protein